MCLHSFCRDVFMSSMRSLVFQHFLGDIIFQYVVQNNFKGSFSFPLGLKENSKPIAGKMRTWRWWSSAYTDHCQLFVVDSHSTADELFSFTSSENKKGYGSLWHTTAIIFYGTKIRPLFAEVWRCPVLERWEKRTSFCLRTYIHTVYIWCIQHDVSTALTLLRCRGVF